MFFLFIQSKTVPLFLFRCLLNLVTAEHTRLTDSHTIKSEPIASIDLMERASRAFVEEFVKRYPDRQKKISVYCGTGNNGGDGLAVARLLTEEGFARINVKIIRFSSKATEDFQTNYRRLQSNPVVIEEITENDPFPVEEAEIIIDALLGTGLNKAMEGLWKELVIWIRSLNRVVVSVDIPTGLKSEGVISSKDITIKSDLTITFQRPKINFLLPDSANYIDDFVVADIGLDERYIQSLDTSYCFLTEEDVVSRLKKRKPFSHKGTFGHALIVAGAPQTMGAALLCAEAALRSGAGLTTACIPAEGLTALNVRIPEVMALVRGNAAELAKINWSKYTSIGVGPGLGTSEGSRTILQEVLKANDKPIVIDADAINLISQNYELMSMVPEASVFTPHMKEFDRLFGEHQTWWERLNTGIDRATTLGCTIVLKNRFTILFMPSGKCVFNPTGSPAMASGGMGDVLTGMITSFLAQGYSPEDAAILGVYLHGLAGQQIAEKQKAAVVPAAQLIEEIPKVIFQLTR